MAGKTKKEVLQRPEVTERNHADQDGIVDPESCIKHPLQFHWTLWYQEPDKEKSWGGNLKEVATVGAVEDFWKLCNHIKSPSDLKTGGDCSLFKQGIRPMWEDEKNFRGGRWVINVPRQQHHELDEYWLDTIWCRIGEVFDDPEEICGAVVDVRPKMNRIAIWTSTVMNRDAPMPEKAVSRFLAIFEP
ncbi:eukaryotic translation initiation factor 4E-like [Uranotaenia lowii]|uniref:eukaryotic translation initiation factor 4E-like n=1 Tax=Uranotaenia lowii TaxID=190385 RepID=UPI0024790EAE|nr:eukaryotic translation initiation factor 4E-like [Uranotaenia lowii]XP_055588378.1 eukaryotic translation initiation factor 4E-like [Uranotaenia lowii]XP_055609560.1 eukaryotic translation initiation factor 4E-like [Uranotaenia lowii]XP_055609570.1 eukaryotic translation initiation factor 4E-like [Uranotaenia lowii]